MYGGIKLPEVVHHAARNLGVVHHFAQHHEHGFENVVRIGREFVPPLAVTFGIAFHGQVEQAFLVAEHLVERPLRHPELLRDVVHSYRLDALRDKHMHGLVDNAFFLRRVIAFKYFGSGGKYRKKTYETKKFSIFFRFISK